MFEKFLREIAFEFGISISNNDFRKPMSLVDILAKYLSDLFCEIRFLHSHEVCILVKIVEYYKNFVIAIRHK